MPARPDAPYCTIAPDWTVEVLSPSTEEHDREVKMPIYEREGVRHAWLVDPIGATLEIYTVEESGEWSAPMMFSGGDVVHARPFDAIRLDLSII